MLKESLKKTSAEQSSLRVKNVTAKNFHNVAWEYMERASGISRAQASKHGGWGIMIHPSTDPINWEAWRRYFQRKHIPHGLMTKIENGFEAKYMVPAEMPCDFDAG